MTAILSRNWEVFLKLLSHPFHFEMFPLRFIKKKGLEDSRMAGFGGKGKPWGIDGWSGQIPPGKGCYVVGFCGGSLWVNIDVANGCCNGHGNLNG